MSKPRPSKPAAAILALLAAFALSACVATIPIKVAKTGTKLGVKAAKTSVKTVKAVGGLVIPDDDPAEPASKD